jgi:transcription termination factor NusB
MIADPEDESAIAAMEVLAAIQTILRSICDKPELYIQVEPILAPLIVKIMDPDIGLEFFEEAIKLCSYFTYYAPSVSEFMWSLFPKMVHMFDNWSMDIITDLLVPFDNYISRGTTVFLTGPYLEMVFTMYKKILSDDNCDDRTVADAAKLWEVVLQNCIGKVDQYVEPALELALNRLTKTKKAPLRVLLMEVLANTSYYNPALLLSILEKRGWTKPAFEYWFQSVPKLERYKS